MKHDGTQSNKDTRDVKILVYFLLGVGILANISKFT